MRASRPWEHMGQSGTEYPLSVTLRDNRTGEERTVPTWGLRLASEPGSLGEEFGDEVGMAYIWVEGNYSCDCNRGLVWYSWPGEAFTADYETTPRQCGSDHYRLVRLVREDTDEVLALNDDYPTETIT